MSKWWHHEIPGRCSISVERWLISLWDNLWYVEGACWLWCWDTWMEHQFPPAVCQEESLRPPESSALHSLTCPSRGNQSTQCNNPAEDTSELALWSPWSSGWHKLVIYNHLHIICNIQQNCHLSANLCKISTICSCASLSCRNNGLPSSQAKTTWTITSLWSSNLQSLLV